MIMITQEYLDTLGNFARSKVAKLRNEIDNIDKELEQMESNRCEKALLLIESRIDKFGLCIGLEYINDNYLRRITNKHTRKQFMIEAELYELAVRNKEISNEIIRLTKLEKAKTILPVERAQKDHLTKKQKEIKKEQTEKKVELALSFGDYLETEEENIIKNASSNDIKLILANLKLLKLEKKLSNLRDLNMTRSSTYLDLKSEYIDTIRDAEALKYTDEHMKEVKTSLDKKILMISADIEGLVATKKATVSEIHRIYGYKSMTNLNDHESLKLDNYDKQKNQLDEEILKKRLELAPLIGKQQEENYISQNSSSNQLEQELIKLQGQKSGQNMCLRYLETYHLTDSCYYLDKKLESINTDYSVTSLEYYLENLDKVNNNTELKYLKLSSEIKGHIKRAMSIETELERVNESNKNNSQKLQEHVNTLTAIYEQDISAIEVNENQQELVDKVVDLHVIRNSKVKEKSKIYK